MTSSTSPITAMRPSARVLITLLAALSMVFAQLVGFTAQPASASNTWEHKSGERTCDFLSQENKEESGDGNVIDESSTWGKLDWSADDSGSDSKFLDATINAGWTVDVCVKTGGATHLYTLSSSDRLPIGTETVDLNEAKDRYLTGISHVSWGNAIPPPATVSLTIDKEQIDDRDAAADETFTFTVVCDDGTDETETITGTGTATVDGIAENADCTVTETVDGGADTTEAGTDKNDLTETDKVDNVDVGTDGTTVYFTNTYDAPPPPPPGDGTIIVAKVVDGDGDAPEGNFGFTLICDDTSETFTLGDGDTDTFTREGGFEGCEVTETDDLAANATSWAITGDVTDSGSGTATGDDPGFDVDEDQTATVTFTNTYDAPEALTPGIGIVKTAVSADVDFTFSNGTLTVLLTEGESAEITYEYLITNEGDEDLDTLGLEDDVIGDLTDEFVDAVDDEYGETFPVGGEVTVTATYTTTADDFATGSVTNVATVTGTGVTSGDNVDAEDDETIDIAGVLGVVFEPGISVEKTAIGGVSDNVVVFNADGDAVAVTYQFVVTNTGDEDLDSLTVIDDKIGDLTEAFLAALGGTVLPVGASVTFTAVHEVVIDDFKDDSLTNVVEATGVGVESRGAVDDDDSETISFTQVAGVVIVDDSQPVATEATTLPRTGFDTGVLAGLGLLLAALGAAALLLGRRREEGDLS